MAGKGLTGIDFSLFDRYTIIIFVAEGIILSHIGIIEIEKIMSMKQFLYAITFMYANQYFIFWIAGPTIHFF